MAKIDARCGQHGLVNINVDGIVVIPPHAGCDQFQYRFECPVSSDASEKHFEERPCSRVIAGTLIAFGVGIEPVDYTVNVRPISPLEAKDGNFEADMIASMSVRMFSAAARKSLLR